jgi:hypothetical protein
VSTRDGTLLSADWIVLMADYRFVRPTFAVTPGKVTK